MTLLDAVADGVAMGLRTIRRRWGLVVALAVVLFIINAPVLVVAQEESAEVQQLLSAGDKLLIAGRSSYPDAIAKYSAAMNLAPSSAKAALRRAELYWMMKKWAEVKQDLKKVLSLDPANKKALERQATLLAAEGDVTEASAVYKRLAAAHGSGKKADEALQKAGKTAMLGRSWDLIKSSLDAKDLDARIENNNKCVNILSELITEFAKDNMALHLKRAECAVTGRNQRAAMDELKYLLTRDSQNLRAIALNAKSLRQLGSIEGAKREVKRCLSLDPEDAGCVELHKSIKSYAKVTDAIERSVNKNAWEEAIKSIDSLLSTEVDPPNLEQLWTWKCKGYLELREVKLGIEACTTCIRLEGGKDDNANPALIDVYLNRADIHLLDDAIEEASADVQKAANINGQNDRVKEYQQKLENIKRNKARKDYYKILGVPKTANEKSIKSAYRKLAMKYHPDQYRSKDISEVEREKNDRRFRDINEAKEILLDEEKRRRYDNGEDPANPQQQQQQQHQQFHFGGGFPGGFGNGFPGNGGFHFNFG